MTVRRDHRRRGAPVRGVAATLVAGFVCSALPACSGGADEAAPPTPIATSASPSPTATSPTPTATSSTELPSPSATLPPRPPASNDAASRKTFARFVIDSWGHALATSDAEAVTRLSPRGQQCQGCKQLAAEMERRAEEGWSVDFTGVTVHSIKVRPGDAARVWVAEARISIPETRSYFDDGTYRNDNDARRNVRFAVTMRLDGKRYSLLAFSLG